MQTISERGTLKIWWGQLARILPHSSDFKKQLAKLPEHNACQDNCVLVVAMTHQ